MTWLDESGLGELFSVASRSLYRFHKIFFLPYVPCVFPVVQTRPRVRIVMDDYVPL